MGSIIGWMVGKQILGRTINERGARSIAHVGLFLLILAVLGIVVACIRRDAVSDYSGKQQAQIQKANRKADDKAANERKADDDRLDQETSEAKEAVNEARRERRDPRAAYYECIRVQQAARRERKQPPEC